MSLNEDIAELRRRAQNCREAEDHFRDLMRPQQMQEAAHSAVYLSGLADRLEQYAAAFDVLRAEHVPNVPAGTRMIRGFKLQPLQFPEDEFAAGNRLRDVLKAPQPLHFETGASVTMGELLTVVEYAYRDGELAGIMYATGRVIAIAGDGVTLHLIDS